MTIAAAIVCPMGVVFGCDTEETSGYVKGQVWKMEVIMGNPEVSAVITGSCEDAHLMDAVMESICDDLQATVPQNNGQTQEAIKRTVYDLYAKPIAVFPQKAKKVSLLVGVKLKTEQTAGTWRIESSVVRRMKHYPEVVGCGWLAEPFLPHLLSPGMALDDAELAMMQLIYLAKTRISYVGGDSFIATLRNDGSVSEKRIFYDDKKQMLCDHFLLCGRDLLLATGSNKVSDEQYSRILETFGENVKHLRKRLVKP